MIIYQQRNIGAQSTVYTVSPHHSNQPQVYIAQVPNNFPNTTHVSPSVAQVEHTLNHHYAQNQPQYFSPPAYTINDNNRRY